MQLRLQHFRLLFTELQRPLRSEVRINLVCDLILESIQEIYPQRHVLSVDEKTSIQALERMEGRAPDSKGRYKRKEFEYVRYIKYCNLCLIKPLK